MTWLDTACGDDSNRRIEAIVVALAVGESTAAAAEDEVPVSRRVNSSDHF